MGSLLPPLTPPNDPKYVAQEQERRRQIARKKNLYQRRNAEEVLRTYNLESSAPQKSSSLSPKPTKSPQKTSVYDSKPADDEYSYSYYSSSDEEEIPPKPVSRTSEKSSGRVDPAKTPNSSSKRSSLTEEKTKSSSKKSTSSSSSENMKDVPGPAKLDLTEQLGKMLE